MKGFILISCGFCVVFLLAFCINSTAQTITVDDDGTADYSIIQDAIDNASTGDTVYVFNGTYYENVEIEKDINLTGENAANTIIDGLGHSEVLYIRSMWINVSSFTLTNASRGIDVRNSKGIIENNIIDSGYYYGISVGSWGKATHPIIRNNIILNASHCIEVTYDAKCTIVNNTLFVGYGEGIRVGRAEVTIIHNTIETSGGNSIGISLDSDSYAYIIENDIYCKENGIVYTSAVESQYGTGYIFNSSFDFPPNIQEFVMGFNGSLTLFNTTYDTIYHYFDNSTAVVISKWWVEINVNSSSNVPVPFANIIIENATGHIEYQNKIDQNGHCKLALTERIEYVNRTISHTPHKITASIGTSYTTHNVAITDNKIIWLTLDIQKANPVAAFEVTPIYANVSVPFNFDPTDCSDEIDDNLQVRWDWNNDSIWDTDWLDCIPIGHFYSSPDVYTIKMEVMDFMGLTDITYQEIRVYLDTDGDGYLDEVDAFSNNPTQWNDTDGDGYGDNPSGSNPDAFPNDSTQWLDTDGDGYGDNQSGNNPDVYPNDPTQWMDTDGDGYGDNSDGTNPDAFPTDPTEWKDNDNDSIGDNADRDDDNDDMPDEWELKYGLNTTDSLDAIMDIDGDGFSNLAEYNDGRNPLDPNSRPGFLYNYWWAVILLLVVTIVGFAFFLQRKPPLQYETPPAASDNGSEQPPS
jgi:hypothetical protein